MLLVTKAPETACQAYKTSVVGAAGVPAPPAGEDGGQLPPPAIPDAEVPAAKQEAVPARIEIRCGDKQGTLLVEQLKVLYNGGGSQPAFAS